MEPQILPEELLRETLLRLPVKSLVRFKCVSKSWLFLISDSHFARLHFDFAAAITQSLLVLSDYKKMLSIDFNAASLHDKSASSMVKFNLPLPQSQDIRILGSCRGFLLLECYQNLLIWNPRTGIHRQLTSPIYSIRYSFLYGFGYDPSTDDYLVTVAFYKPSEEEEEAEEEEEEEEDFVGADDGTFRAQIFSSRANTWQELEGSHMSYINLSVSYSSDFGIYFNDVVHWLARHIDRRVNIIVAFDLMERVFFEIALLDDFDCNIFCSQLRVLGGCLTICAERYDNIAGGIWVMEEYKRQSSWTRRHVNILAQHFSLVCFTRNGDIVGLDYFTELVKFNDNGDMLERRRYCDHHEDCDCDLIALMHTESLLSIPSNR